MCVCVCVCVNYKETRTFSHFAIVPSDEESPDGNIVSPNNLDVRHESRYVDHVGELLRVCKGRQSLKLTRQPMLNTHYLGLQVFSRNVNIGCGDTEVTKEATSVFQENESADG